MKLMERLKKDEHSVQIVNVVNGRVIARGKEKNDV